MKLFFIIISIVFIIVISISCSKSGPESNQQQESKNSISSQTNSIPGSKYEFPDDNGIGPINDVSLGVIDQNLVSQGDKIFKIECVACHQLDSRDVGPPLRNITKKNTPAYIMNYLLNTTEMQRKDPLMQKLVNEYKVFMPDQHLTRDDARALLEFFRSTEN
jgi:cytochrome c551/c552